MAKPGFVYMMTNRNRSVLYTGVTSDLARRVAQHKQGAIGGFTKRYFLCHLVFYEACEDITTAIAREKQLKAGSRKQKEALIASMNPGWLDLSENLG